MRDAKFEWNKECQHIFEQVKQEIANSPLLVHFDPTKEIVLVCDASSYGVGCVLNIIINGEERPVLMKSCKLSPNKIIHNSTEKLLRS